MRSVRGHRAQNAESASYLLIRQSNAPSRGNPLRRMNSRLRCALLFSLLIVLTILFVNLIFIRLDRPDILKLVGKNMQPGEFSPSEPEDAVLERLHHGFIKPVKLPQKIIHLDLKGAPLSVTYLEQIMPILQQLGATGLLIEYEDMFPYHGKLENISAINSYSVNDIGRILEAAKANELTVIPLIQTFGHLEVALKLEEFANLREVPHNPQALCPSRNASVQLITEMLKQVAELHQGHITHIHIGSDEVYALGECGLCLDRMTDHNWMKSDLFLSHVSTVVNIVHSLGYQAIIWDDMFRNVDEEALKSSPLARLVEIMVWNYSKNVNLVGVFSKYMTAGFRGLWIASAFKGAVGPNNQMPEYKLHLLNHLSWVQLLKQFEGRIQVKGIAITGWQRFDHFASLCELFPVGIPVLAVCLAFLQTGRLDDQTLGGIKTILKCNRNIKFVGDILPVNPSLYGSPPPLFCDHPGSRVFFDIMRWDELRKQEKEALKTNYIVGWMSPMNIKHQFSSPDNVMQGTRDFSELISQISKLGEVISEDLLEVSDRATAEEWVETFIEPMIEPLEKLQNSAKLMLGKNRWPRRPLYDSRRPPT
ncbi:hexosaminidase D [Galendromus occidentalis]|uniref:beta-N-acetylhexosaminidase n=1 Tax=Galendromus occidentalis TaxID=34638 RepID=A0AAJ6VVA4_9ACAR|nr:hexosaminidase D [Galendromus occidentalis]